MGARVARSAILALLAGTGFRRAEVVALELAHVHRDNGSIVACGKGDKGATRLPCRRPTTSPDWWLSLRGFAPGPLVCRVRHGGRIVLAALRPAAVRRVERREAEARSQGRNLAGVQAVLGHASPTTTSHPLGGGASVRGARRRS